MLDKYTTGIISRISPEAPVPVLNVKKESTQPGGAGNVVLNMLALKAEVKAVGRIGLDFAGEELKKSLTFAGCDTEHLYFQNDYITPLKNRFIASSQQLIRVDYEEKILLSKDIEDQIIKNLDKLMEDVKAVAISDYGKGFLSDHLLSNIIKKANAINIPVIIDPKGLDFTKYENAYLIKPNLSEAYIAANISKNRPLNEVADTLLKKTKVDNLLITRSEEGITLFNKDGDRKDYPVRSKEVQDVTGAGDTVLATLTVCLANNFSLDKAIELSNIAAGIAIEHVGCARVTISDLAKRLFEFDIGSKIFDEDHIFVLQEVIKENRIIVLGLDSNFGMSTVVLKSILKLSMKNDHKLIIYIIDEDPDGDFLSLLSQLTTVNYIVLKKESLLNLSNKINSNEIYEIQNNELIKHDSVSQLL